MDHLPKQFPCSGGGCIETSERTSAVANLRLAWQRGKRGMLKTLGLLAVRLTDLQHANISHVHMAKRYFVKEGPC